MVSAVEVFTAGVTGLACAMAAALVVRPTRRLAGRVRPYTVVARPALGHAPDVVSPGGSALPRVFGPMLGSLVAGLARRLERRGDDAIARLLQHAGVDGLTPEHYRVRQLVQGAVVAAACGAALLVLAALPVVALAGAGAGFVVGSTRLRRRIERAVAERSTRIRLELYTVNHLLAMHVRTGAGPMQAVQRVVDRGRGIVVQELATVLAWTRRGVGEAEAFRRAAELTPEPAAARSYQLLAAGVERGADLAGALLALSEDMRDARREELHRHAVRRRAAMLVPTIAILAPVMLLFIAAPLPSVVLGDP